MTEMKKGWVWHEVLASDLGVASEYYRSLFGWQAEEMDMGGSPYLMLKSGDNMVGGMMASKDETPTHWLSYLLFEDIKAAEKKIVELGGKILMETFEIPNIGKACIAQDPEGAVFAPFQGNEAQPAPQGPVPDNTVCWTELMAVDEKVMAKFYGELLGWSSEPMGPGVVVFKEGDTMMCSIRKKEGPAAQMPSNWLVYLAVPDVDDYVKKSEALGGRTMMPKTAAGDMGEFAIIGDPTGGVYAFWKHLQH